MMQKMRCFIAIDLPDQILSKLAQKTSEYKKKLPPVVRWVKPENIHLTLKFLGEITPQEVKSIELQLDAIGSKHTPFDLTFSENGVFPNWNRPRILWVGLIHTDALFSLVDEIETELQSIGIPPENRPFSPHITIGRFKDFAKPGEIDLIKQNFCDEVVLDETMTITEIYLYQSILHPSGPEYTRLQITKLSHTEKQC